MAARMRSTAKRWGVGFVVTLVVAGGAACSSRADEPEDTAKPNAAAAKDEPAAARRAVKQALLALTDQKCSRFRQLSADRDSAKKECDGYVQLRDGRPYTYEIDLGKVFVTGDTAVVKGKLAALAFAGDLETYTMEYRAIKVDGVWKYDTAEVLSFSKDRRAGVPTDS